MLYASALHKKQLLDYTSKQLSLGKAMPIDEIESLVPLSSFEVLGIRAQLVSNEDQVKSLVEYASQLEPVVTRLVANVTQAHRDFVKLIERFDKKSKDAEKAQTQKVAPAKKKKLTSKSEAPSGHAQDADFLFAVPLEDAVFQEIKSFDNPEDFQKRGGKRLSSEPYSVNNCKDLEAKANDRATKAAIGVFRIQYPSSGQAKTSKRGQAPLLSDAKESIREQMLDLAPATTITTKANDNSMAARVTNAISIFACSTGMVYQGLEKQGMASLRYQVSGEREVIVIDFLTLSDFAAKIGLDIEPEQDFFDYLKQLVGSLIDAPTREALKLSGGVIRRGIVKEGGFLHVPAASYILERTIGSNNVVGLRTMFLPPPDSPAFAALFALKEQATAVASTPLTDFWQSIYDDMYKDKLRATGSATVAPGAQAAAQTAKPEDATANAAAVATAADAKECGAAAAVVTAADATETAVATAAALSKGKAIAASGSAACKSAAGKKKT